MCVVLVVAYSAVAVAVAADCARFLRSWPVTPPRPVTDAALSITCGALWPLVLIARGVAAWRDR